MKLDGTLARTKKHLDFFGKAFCHDKVAITLLILIVGTGAALCYVCTMTSKS